MSKISERIRYVGVNDCEKSLFEGIWPLPFGISYNSYLIVDKKIALIDTIDEGFEKEYLEKIKFQILSQNWQMPRKKPRNIRQLFKNRLR